MSQNENQDEYIGARIFFSVTSKNRSLAELSEMFDGLEPDETSWSKGDKNIDGRAHDHSRWEIQSEEGLDSITEGVQEFLDKVEPTLREAFPLPSDFDLVLGVVVYIRIANDWPDMQLDPETLKRISSLGASLMVDVFVVSTDESDE